MGTQYFQLICENGHQISFWHKLNSPDTEHCEKCGESTIDTCPSCKFPIHGYMYPSGVITAGPKTFPKPYYCKKCGKPYPWTELVINNAVELISLDETLPTDHKSIIKSALPDLLVETPTTPVAVAKYKKYISTAQDFIKDGMKNLMVDVVSETVKKSIWG